MLQLTDCTVLLALGPQGGLMFSPPTLLSALENSAFFPYYFLIVCKCLIGAPGTRKDHR